MKIGLFGGTFDPVHNAHIKIAEESIKQFQLDEVWFLPEKNPKRKTDASGYTHRLCMLNMATRHNNMLITDKFDFQKNGTDYDYSFIKFLKKKYPKYNFYILIGADIVEYLDKWDNIEKYCNDIEFIIAKRPKYSLKNNLNTLVNNRIPFNYLDMNCSHASSRKIRLSPNSCRSVNHLVKKYIQDNMLYQNSSYKVRTKTAVGNFFIIIRDEFIIKTGFGNGPDIKELPDHKYIHLINQYFNGGNFDLTSIKHAQTMSVYSTKVLDTITKIPYGKTSSYKLVATLAGNEKATRATGTVCRKNNLPVIIPCHRVVKSDGSIGEYRYGHEVKSFLLDLEKSNA